MKRDYLYATAGLGLRIAAGVLMLAMVLWTLGWLLFYCLEYFFPSLFW